MCVSTNRGGRKSSIDPNTMDGDLDNVNDPLLPLRGRGGAGAGAGDDFDSLLTTHLISREVEDRDSDAPQLSQRMQVAEAMLLEREARGLIDEAPMNPQPSWKPEQQHISARAEKRALKRKEYAALEQAIERQEDPRKPQYFKEIRALGGETDRK